MRRGRRPDGHQMAAVDRSYNNGRVVSSAHDESEGDKTNERTWSAATGPSRRLG